MTINDIVNKAKVVVISDRPTYKENVINFIKHHETVQLIYDNKEYLYIGWKNNEHHYTTHFHQKYVIPAISKLLCFSYDYNDYEFVKKFYDKFDITYLKPKQEMLFNVKGLEYDINYDCGFDGLMDNKNSVRYGLWTEYHGLYAFPHSCSIVTNLTKHNNKKILISGDSQAIPFIPFLCTIYKEVWYFDNRCDKKFGKLFESTIFDDVLFEIYKGDMTYYIDKNLK